MCWVANLQISTFFLLLSTYPSSSLSPGYHHGDPYRLSHYYYASYGLFDGPGSYFYYDFYYDHGYDDHSWNGCGICLSSCPSAHWRRTRIALVILNHKCIMHYYYYYCCCYNNHIYYF